MVLVRSECGMTQQICVTTKLHLFGHMAKFAVKNSRPMMRIFSDCPYICIVESFNHHIIMKRVILISAILVALACQPAHATSDVEAMVRAIAQAEELVPQRIANRPYDDVNSGRLVISDAEILPATGLYRCTITYYYDSDMDEEINMHYYLYYVTIDLTFCSNLYHHSMTFFYDEPGLPRHVRYVTGRGVDEDFEADSTIDAYLDEFGHVAFKHEDLSTAEMAVEPLGSVEWLVEKARAHKRQFDAMKPTGSLSIE